MASGAAPRRPSPQFTGGPGPLGRAAHQSCFGPTWPSKVSSEPGYLGSSNLCLQKEGRKRQWGERGQASFPTHPPPQRQRGAQGNPVGALPNCPGVCSPMWDRGSWPSPSPPSRNCPYWCSLPPPLPPPPAALFWVPWKGDCSSCLPPSHPGLGPHPDAPPPSVPGGRCPLGRAEAGSCPGWVWGRHPPCWCWQRGLQGESGEGAVRRRHPAVGHILALLRWSGALGQPQEETRIPLPERLLAGPTWLLLLG